MTDPVAALRLTAFTRSRVSRPRAGGHHGLAPLVLALAVIASGCASASSDGIFWVYHRGHFAWPGDYSFVAVPDYADKSGAPASGTADIRVNVTGAWGGFQPFATNWDFDTTPYAYLSFALKPTTDRQTLDVYFMKVGDIEVGRHVNALDFGPKPVAGQWATYTIPLAAIGVDHLHVYKFAVQDKTGLTSNVFYLDDIGFLPAVH